MIAFLDFKKKLTQDTGDSNTLGVVYTRKMKENCNQQTSNSKRLANVCTVIYFTFKKCAKYEYDFLGFFLIDFFN